MEPVVGNITSTLGLNQSSLRGRVKVDTQWRLYCGLVRKPSTNIDKIAVKRRRLVNGTRYVAFHEFILPVKQEAGIARIHSCEHGGLCRDYGEEPLRSPYPLYEP